MPKSATILGPIISVCVELCRPLFPSFLRTKRPLVSNTLEALVNVVGLRAAIPSQHCFALLLQAQNFQMLDILYHLSINILQGSPEQSCQDRLFSPSPGDRE